MRVDPLGFVDVLFIGRKLQLLIVLDCKLLSLRTKTATRQELKSLDDHVVLLTRRQPTSASERDCHSYTCCSPAPAGHEDRPELLDPPDRALEPVGHRHRRRRRSRNEATGLMSDRGPSAAKCLHQGETRETSEKFNPPQQCVPLESRDVHLPSLTPQSLS